MVVPIRVPLLLHYIPKEDAVNRMDRQAAQADDVLFVDACTEHGNGMGLFLLTDVGWNSFSAPELLQHVGYDGEIANADINLLEFATAVIALCTVVALRVRQGFGVEDHRHIHI